jgi:hypothetical protein
MEAMEDTADFGASLSVGVESGKVGRFVEASPDVRVGESAERVGAVHDGAKELSVVAGDGVERSSGSTG